jgi:hypothetical protein
MTVARLLNADNLVAELRETIEYDKRKALEFDGLDSAKHKHYADVLGDVLEAIENGAFDHNPMIIGVDMANGKDFTAEVNVDDVKLYGTYEEYKASK